MSADEAAAPGPAPGLPSPSPSKKQQHWVPLEANPEVFTAFARKLGLPPASAHFVDVYGLDEVRGEGGRHGGEEHGRARAV